MSVTAIIVAYNSAEVIESALSCVYAHPEVAECIVVDNASTDSTADIIHRKFPEARIIANKENLGFGVACNQALTQAASEFALLLNPDSTIDSEGITTLLKSFVLYPNAAIIAPVLSEHSFRQPLVYDKELKYLPQINSHIFMVPFVSGAMAMWRMDYMRRVGFFDPAFFLFFEDDDISIRVRRAGYDLLLVSGINAHHTPGQSCVLTEAVQSLKLRSSTWSYLYIHRKYKGEKYARIMARLMIARAVWRSFLYRLTSGGLLTEESTREKQERILQGREKALAALSEKRVAAERRHSDRLDAAMKAHENRWVALINEQDNILAAAIDRHNEVRAAEENRLKEEWERAVQEFEAHQESRIREFEAHWEEITDKHDSAFSKALSQTDEAHSPVYEKLEKEWGNAVQQYEVRRKARETEHESHWMEKMKEQGEALAVAAKKHEAEWAVVASGLEAEWLAIEKEHTSLRKAAMQGYEGQRLELIRAYENKRKGLVEKHEADWKIITGEYETIWIAMTKEHEKRREAAMHGFQIEWEEFHAAHEKRLADMAIKRDEECAVIAKGFEEQWAELARKHEKIQANVLKAFDTKWMAIEKQRENRDRLRAALHFLHNPEKFRL